MERTENLTSPRHHGLKTYFCAQQRPFYHRLPEHFQFETPCVSTHTAIERVLGKMGEFEGEGTPFCRDKMGFLPPQENQF